MVGHFIKHKDGSEPRTHRGGWESSCPHAPEGLGGGSAGLEEEGHGRRRGRGTRARKAWCSSVGQSTAWGSDPARGGAPAWGGARAAASKKRSVGLGTVARGTVDGCAGNGGARRHGVVLRRRRGGVGVGLKLIWKISTRALLYTNEVHHCRF